MRRSALAKDEVVTVSCAEGDTGFVYDGKLDFSIQSSAIDNMPELGLKIMMNVGNPDRAFDFAGLPNDGGTPCAFRSLLSTV